MRLSPDAQLCRLAGVAGQSGSRGWCAWGATGRGALFPRGAPPPPKLPLPIRLSRGACVPGILLFEVRIYCV